jgi:hypothetical protein
LWPLYQPTLADFQLLISHIVNLGYGIVSRDDNPMCAAFLRWLSGLPVNVQ